MNVPKIPNHLRSMYADEQINIVEYDDGRTGPGLHYKKTDFLKQNPDTLDARIETKVKRKPGQIVHPFWLYALKLEDKKYYIGITGKKNPYDRLLQHGDIFGARWTAKHKPLEVAEIRDLGKVTKEEAEGYEQSLTWNYMQLYGYKNVRGGNTTYTGRIFVIGSRVIFGWSIKQFFIRILVLLAFAYFIFN